MCARFPSRLSTLPLALALVLLVAACSTAPETTAPSASSAAAGTPGGVPEVLDFTAPALGGGTVDGTNYAGKDTAIWFWAPW